MINLPKGAPVVHLPTEAIPQSTTLYHVINTSAPSPYRGNPSAYGLITSAPPPCVDHTPTPSHYDVNTSAASAESSTLWPQLSSGASPPPAHSENAWAPCDKVEVNYILNRKRRMEVFSTSHQMYESSLYTFIHPPSLSLCVFVCLSPLPPCYRCSRQNCFSHRLLET